MVLACVEPASLEAEVLSFKPDLVRVETLSFTGGPTIVGETVPDFLLRGVLLIFSSLALYQSHPNFAR